MEVISWLGIWYVKSELYENAVTLFERAAEVEPDEIKWKVILSLGKWNDADVGS